MKKDPKDYTQGEAEYDRRRLAVKAGTPNAYVYFKNIAVTMDGDLCVGMTKNTQGGYFSCSAIVRDGVRANDPLRWDFQGGSFDGLSDLNVRSVHQDVRTV